MDRYDAGHLSGFGGGEVGWWQDYIRAEIERANDFCAVQCDSLADENAALEEEIASLKTKLADTYESLIAEQLASAANHNLAIANGRRAKEEHERATTAEQARAVAEGNLELRSMSNLALRQLIGEMSDEFEIATRMLVMQCLLAGDDVSRSPLVEGFRDLIARARGAAS